MKKLIHILFLVIIINSSSFAQVTGIVHDEHGAPLSFANVILSSALDSSIIEGAFSGDDGTFGFTCESSEQLLIKVSMIGYVDYYSDPFSLKDQNAVELDCGLSNSAYQLEGVVVEATVPFLEQSAGKLTVNVAKNISGINGSMLDVLKKVPGVLVINGNVSLAGTPNVSILMDGKSTDYLDITSLLSEMSADDIEKIEIISQAGATMDASGSGGVINIILKKNTLNGNNGSISAGVGRGDLSKYSTNLRMNHRKGAININGSLGLSHDTYWESIDVTRAVGDQTYVQSSYDPHLPKTLKLGTGIDWDVNDKHAVGASFKGFMGRNDKVKSSFTSIYDRDNLLEEVTGKNANDKSWNYLNSDLYYNWKIDTSGQKLSFSSNYSRFSRASTSLSTATSSVNRFFAAQKQEEPGNTNIAAFKLDYTLPISQQWKMNAGLKYSWAKADNDLRAFEQNDEIWKNNKDLSNHYIFSESIKAAYLQTSFTGKKVSLNVGLRYEFSNSNGYSATLDSTNSRKIGQLFPSASLDIPLNSTFGVSAAYSYRIKRPGYSSLNPFIYYFDPFSYQKGNPYLKPALTHSAKLSLTYNKQPFFNIGYQRTSDVLMAVSEQDDETGATSLMTINMDRHEKYKASLYFPLSFVKGLDGYGGVITSYDVYKSSYLGELYNKKKFSYVAFLQASVKLPKDFKIEFGGWYNSGGLNGIMEYNSLFGTSFGIEKQLMDKQLSLKLSIEDPVNKDWTANINYANMDMDITSKWETKIVNFQATYKFGNRFLKKGKKHKSSASEEAKRVLPSDW